MPGSFFGGGEYRIKQNASRPVPFEEVKAFRSEVMVFIEGGGFLVGDKYQSGMYDGRKLVDMQDVILVNINYRWGKLVYFNSINFDLLFI